MVRNVGWALAAAASLAGIGAASAADMAVKARPLPPPIYSWTGCYIGLSAGGKGVGIDETLRTSAVGGVPATASDLGRREAETWIAGGQVGCNYQTVSWVPFFGGGPAILTSDTRTLLGVTVGAGVEHAVTDNFTLGLEGRYTWYDRERFNAGVVPVGVIIGAAPILINGNAYRDVKIE